MSIKRYRSKPVTIEIEAIEVNWDNWLEICEFVDNKHLRSGVYLDDKFKRPLPVGMTSDILGVWIVNFCENVVLAPQSHYIVKSGEGRYRVMSPKQLEDEFEEIQTGAQPHDTTKDEKDLHIVREFVTLFKSLDRYTKMSMLKIIQSITTESSIESTNTAIAEDILHEVEVMAKRWERKNNKKPNFVSLPVIDFNRLKKEHIKPKFNDMMNVVGYTLLDMTVTYHPHTDAMIFDNTERCDEHDYV